MIASIDRRESSEPPTRPAIRRLQWVVFALLFVTYAYFFQGGGWNQNARFDQVRAIVEQGTLAVNDFLVYRAMRDEVGELRLQRRPVPEGAPLQAVARVANTGDLAELDGAFFPNKPPGTVLLAVPAYFVVHLVERMAGVDPDHWWTQTFNVYLTTVLSVGLIGALGGVLLFRISRRLSPDCPPVAHAAAALTLGLGTLFLPFATMLFDHVEAAVLLLLAFGCLQRSRADGSRPRRWLLAAGLAAGGSVVVNYLAAVQVVLLGAYAFWVCRPRRETVWFVAGGLPAALLLAWYHQACFGSAFAIANTFQNEIFLREGLVLGVFGLPDAKVLGQLLIGARRGLFLTSPVLLLGFVGLVPLLRRKGRRAEAVLILGSFLALWLINGSFREWHGGFTIGPRYLIPALPLLALGLARMFSKAPRVSYILAALSAGIMLTVTAVDPQPPPRFASPLTGYIAPLLQGETIDIEGIAIEGPVSANPIGVYEPWYYRRFPPRSTQVRWSSFNAGEFLFPRSRLSLVPLLAILVAGGVLVHHLTRARPPLAPR